MSIQFGPEWNQFEARLRAFPQSLESNMRQTMNFSLLMIERDARRFAAQDTRRLSGSITSEIRGSGVALEGRVGPSVQYGRFVEFGRRPGKPPPVDALMGWVRRHSEFRFSRRSAAREAAVRGRAFALQRKIRLRGVRAQPFLVPAYERNLSAITALFARMGARVVVELAGGSQS